MAFRKKIIYKYEMNDTRVVSHWVKLSENDTENDKSTQTMYQICGANLKKAFHYRQIKKLLCQKHTQNY